VALGDLIVRIGADIAEWTQKLNTVVEQANAMAEAVEKQFAGVEAMGRRLAVAGAELSGLFTLPIVGIGQAALETSGKFEMTEVAFTHYLGSAQKAKEMLAELYNFGATTPFQIGEVTHAAQTLMAMKVEAKDVIPWLRTIGDQLAAVGKPENLQRVVLALTEMSHQTKGYGTMLRELMQDAGIRGKEYLAEAFNIPIGQIDAALKKGLIPGAAAVKVIMAGMVKDSGGLMTQLMSAFGAQMSNIQDQWTVTKKAIGDQLLPFGKLFLELGANVLSAVNSMAQGFGQLGQPVKVFILALAAVIAAVGPVLIGLGGIMMAVPSLAAAFAPLAAAIGVSVLGFFGWTAAIGIAVAAIAGLYVWFKDLSPWTKLAIEIGLVGTALTFLPQIIAGVVAAWGTFTYALGLASLASGTFGSQALLVGAWLNKDLFSAVTNGTQAIARMAQVSILAAGAFAGWELGKWLRETIPAMAEFGKWLGDWIAKIPGVITLMNLLGGTTAKIDTANKDLANSVAGLAKRLEAHGIVIKQGSLSLEDYSVKLRSAAASFNGLTDAAGKKPPVPKWMQDVLDKINATTEGIKKHSSALTEDEKAAQRQAKATEDMGNRYRKEAKDYVASAEKFNAITLRWEESNQHLVSEFEKDHEKMRKAGLKTVEVLVPALERLKGPVLDAINQQARLAKAYETLGVESAASLQKQAAQAQAAYEIIRQSGTASALDIQQAWVRQEEAREKAAVEAGDVITKAQKRQLEKQSQDVADALDKDKGAWSNFADEVGSQISGLGNKITNDLFNGQFGLQALISILQDVGKAFVKAFIDEGAKSVAKFVVNQLKDMEFSLSGIISKIGSIITGLGKILGIGGSVAGGAASAAGGVASAAGGVASAAGGAASAAGGVASAGTSAASSGASAAAGIAGASLTGIVGAVGSVVSAISGVIGNFQMSHMNKLLGEMEVSTRSTMNDLANLRRDQWDRHNGLLGKLDALFNGLLEKLNGIWYTVGPQLDRINDSIKSGGGKGSVVININGAQSPKDIADQVVKYLKLNGVTV